MHLHPPVRRLVWHTQAHTTCEFGAVRRGAHPLSNKLAQSQRCISHKANLGTHALRTCAARQHKQHTRSARSKWCCTPWRACPPRPPPVPRPGMAACPPPPQAPLRCRARRQGRAARAGASAAAAAVAWRPRWPHSRADRPTAAARALPGSEHPAVRRACCNVLGCWRLFESWRRVNLHVLTLQKWGLPYPRGGMVLSALLLGTVGDASRHALLEAGVLAQQLRKRSFACAHARH